MTRFFEIVIGTLAGIVKFGPAIVFWILFGKSPPPLKESVTAQLGAAAAAGAATHETESSDADADDDVRFEDVFFESNDGTKLHAVVDAGDRRVQGRRPIVFVNGFPELWISWSEQMRYFSRRGHPVAALHPRGYGLSDKPRNVDAYDRHRNLSDDVRAAVRRVVARDPSSATTPTTTTPSPLLVAHDWGAIVGWTYVSQIKTTKDSEVAGYVSLSVPPPECFQANMSWTQKYRSLYMLFFNVPRLPEIILSFNNAWCVAMLVTTTKNGVVPAWKINAYRSNCLQPGALTAQLNYYRSLVHKRPRGNKVDRLGPKRDGTPGRLLDLPVLMIHGKDDDFLGCGIFDGYEKYLTNARLEIIENCSHWITSDHPNRVNQEIEKFLDQLS